MSTAAPTQAMQAEAQTAAPAPGAPAPEALTPAEAEALVRELRSTAFPYFSGPSGATIYLDSAASAQKAEAALAATESLYTSRYANVHRGAYRLSAEATAAYEGARRQVARFLGAASEKEVVFLRGTTEAINLIAGSWGARLQPGDEIIVSELEHHANLVPWQLLAERQGLTLRFWRMDEHARLPLERLEALFTPRTKLVAMTHASNAFGTLAPVAEAAALAHAHGALLAVDGAQAVPHLPVSLPALGADFYAFSAHKLYGPTGIGALWAREELLQDMPPWQGGGEMITEVLLEKSRFAPPPMRFEAGTPAIAEAVGLGAVCAWLSTLPLAALWDYERTACRTARDALAETEGLALYGPRRL